MAQKRPRAAARTGRAADRTRVVLRGNALATVDDSGRLKLPASFRRQIAEAFGPQLFLTSVHGDAVLVYPLAVWEEREQRLLALSRQHPSVAKFLTRVSYHGAEATLDGKGRVVVPPVLRESAQVVGEVAVLGQLDHLAVWNNAAFRRRLAAEPFTDDDQRALAELGL